MFNAVIPEPRRRELLADDDGAAFDEAVANAEDATGRVVQRKGVVDDVVGPQFEEPKHRMGHVEEPEVQRDKYMPTAIRYNSMQSKTGTMQCGNC